MLDYLYNAGFTKTYDEFKAEAPELVRSTMAIWPIHVADTSSMQG